MFVPSLSLVATAVLGAAGPPPTTQTDVDVRWSGPAACVSEERLVATLEQLVPGGIEGPVELNAWARADVWTVQVTFRGVRREVTHADCGLLTEAVALTVAVRADPVASAAAVQLDTPLQRPQAKTTPTVRSPRRDSVGGRTQSAPARPDPTDESARPSSRDGWSAGLRWRWQGGVRAGLELGTLPRAAGRIAAEGGARIGAALIEASVAATLAPSVRSDNPGVDVAFLVFSGALRGCYVFTADQVDVPLCAGAEVGLLRARPRELSAPRDVNALWLAPTAGFRLLRWWGRAAPMAFVDVAAPVLRHRFEVEGIAVHTLPPLVVRAGVGVRWGAR